MLSVNSFPIKERKYTILDRMQKLPHNEFVKAKKRLPKLVGKTPRTFERWLYATFDDTQEIPATSLRIIAVFLGCSMEELFNSPPPTLNSGGVRRKKAANLAVQLNLVK